MLIHCHECGKEISPYAKYCPNCGGPNIEYVAKKIAYKEKKATIIAGAGNTKTGILRAFTPFLVVVIGYLLSLITKDLFPEDVGALIFMLGFFFWPLWIRLHLPIKFIGGFFMNFLVLVLIAALSSVGRFENTAYIVADVLFMYIPVAVSIGEVGWGVHLILKGKEQSKTKEMITGSDLLMEQLEDL